MFHKKNSIKKLQCYDFQTLDIFTIHYLEI